MMRDVQLQTLLDQVDEAVSRADLTGLTDLTAALEIAVRDFDPATDPTLLRKLTDRAGRVAQRLDAARRGVQSARRRLQDIRTACELRTYDRAGQAQSLTAGPLPTARRF